MRVMGRCGIILVVASALLAWLGTDARADYRPRVAVVMCEDAYAADPFTTHSSSQALVGLAGLVGVPYETITLAELLAGPAGSFTSVWFSYCTQLGDSYIAALASFLGAHIDAGGSVFLDGPIGRYDLAGVYRSMAATLPFLGIEDRGGAPVTGFSIYTTNASHTIARRAGHGAGKKLGNGMRADMETVAPLDPGAPGSAVLLEMVAPGGSESYPYLAVSEPGNGARVVAVGAYGTYHGAASPFLHDPPTGFSDNQLLPYLVQALQWAVGPDSEPFAGLQLSHAPMTVIGRLDGDWSGEEEATRRTLQYVLDLADKTGVATIYGVVSGFADDADNWPMFRTFGPRLEATGGMIASHSATHPYEMSVKLDEDGWASEVPGSMSAIRARLASAKFAPAVRAFINPGNTIAQSDYGKFFPAVDLYMTHGFEQLTPYSSGVMGFGLPDGVAPRPVVNNTPVPDYSWLFSDEYQYTVAQASAGQGKLLDYYENTVGRGVLYDQMWHDYAISDLEHERHDAGAAITPLFDVTGEYLGEYTGKHRMYAPSARELIDKMYLAQGVALSSHMNGDELVVELDYSAVPSSALVHVAGMGLRVAGDAGPIRAVSIDGAAHHAYSDDTVILPLAGEDHQTVTITFGTPPWLVPRLTYLSKAFARVAGRDEDTALDVTLAEPGLTTRFCVEALPTSVILHASAYQRPIATFCNDSDTDSDFCEYIGPRAEPSEFCGVVASGATSTGFSTEPFDTGGRLFIQASERPIERAELRDALVVLEIGPGEAGSLYVEVTARLGKARAAGEPVAITMSGTHRLAVAIPAAEEPIELEIELDPSPDTSPAGCGCGAGRNPSEETGSGLASLAILVLAVAVASPRGRGRGRGRRRRRR